MTLLDDFRRVSRRSPCPICDKPDWCLVERGENPARAICARVESSSAAGDAGWLHILRHDFQPRPSRTRRRSVRHVRRTEIAWHEVASKACDAIDPAALEDLANDLGLTGQSLVRLGIGWNGWAWTFPMRDGDREVIGVRLRRPDGSKLSIMGSQQGAFLDPELERGGRLLLCEGPTDTAALMDLGFAAAGRPNCSSGRALLIDLVRNLRPEEAVVVADADGPGRRGAKRLAKSLVAIVERVRLIEPPEAIGDIREWKRRGATTHDVLNVIESAPIMSLVLRAQRLGGGR